MRNKSMLHYASQTIRYHFCSPSNRVALTLRKGSGMCVHNDQTLTRWEHVEIEIENRGGCVRKSGRHI